MEDNQHEITINVPNSNGKLSPLSSNEISRLEEFKSGIKNALALPDTLTDITYECLRLITIPALFTSIWRHSPIPTFIRVGVLILLLILGFTLWHLAAIPEIRGVLFFRLFLVSIGVILPLLS